MPDFNIDDVLGKFGETSKPAAVSGNLDVDNILSQFGGNIKTAEPAPADRKRVLITQPPQSSEYGETGGTDAAPNKNMPVDSPFGTSPSAYENFNSGKETISSGIDDLNTGHPYKGVGKAALGALQIITSPVTGIINDTITKPGNRVSEGFGDVAGDLASAAIPMVPGGNAVIKAIPKNKALSTLVENIGSENLPAVVSAMKANPRLAPVDLSPRVLQDAQHLFANDGPQIDYLAKTSAARMDGRKSAINAAYDTSSGVVPDLAQKMTDLANASKKVGNDQINPLVKAAKPVDVTNTVDKIDSILKPGATKVISEESTLALPAVKQALSAARSWLTNGKELRTGAEDLHDIQKSLRRQGYSLTQSSNSGEREVGKALLNVRNNLVSDIDKASPGYSKALDNYRDEMHIADAFKQGHDNIFTSSKKIENDPSFTKKWFEGLTDNEKAAAKEGSRAAIHTEMGVAKNGALAGESIARSDFNKAKMETIFGKEEAEKLFNQLAVERAIANTHNKIVEGSQTAMRTASKSQFALPTKSDAIGAMLPSAVLEGANMISSGIPGVGIGAGLAVKGAAAVKDAVKLKLAREHNTRYAQYALPTEGPSRDELIKALEDRIPKPKLPIRSIASLVKP